MLLRLIAAVALASLALSCNGDGELNEVGTMLIGLPDGTRVKAEVMTKPEDMMRGMMFRDRLPKGRGMLFIHGSPGRYPYWMYNVKVPLDIIWLGLDRRIVEISANTPPCRETSAKNCPNYGGQEEAAYVLELPAGSAARHGLRRGDRLNF